jgi:hypothetical protein
MWLTPMDELSDEEIEAHRWPEPAVAEPDLVIEAPS